MDTRCGAKKRDGSLCQKYPIQGRTRCRLHGGATPAGILSHAFIHGKYCKALPAHLRARYADSETGSALLSHTDDIRLLDVRLQTLAGALVEDDDEVWEKILDTAETRSKLVQAEVKLLTATDQMLSKEESLLLLARIATIIKLAVNAHTDEATGKCILGAVAQELMSLRSFVQKGPQGAIADN